MVANVQDVSPDILDFLTANNVTVLQLQLAMKRQVISRIIIIFIYWYPLIPTKHFLFLGITLISLQGNVSVHLMSLEQRKNHVQCAKKIPSDMIQLQGVKNATAQSKEQSTEICPVVWRAEIASKFCSHPNRIDWSIMKKTYI